MQKLVCFTACLAWCLATTAYAEGPALSGSQGESESRIVIQTLTPVYNNVPAAAKPSVVPDDYPGERGTAHSLSTVLAKGADKQGLTMEEKWSNDVVVCDRMQTTGTRHMRTVCRTRGEWQTLRSNGREILDRGVSIN